MTGFQFEPFPVDNDNDVDMSLSSIESDDLKDVYLDDRDYETLNPDILIFNPQTGNQRSIGDSGSPQQIAGGAGYGVPDGASCYGETGEAPEAEMDTNLILPVTVEEINSDCTSSANDYVSPRSKEGFSNRVQGGEEGGAGLLGGLGGRGSWGGGGLGRVVRESLGEKYGNGGVGEEVRGGQNGVHMRITQSTKEIHKSTSTPCIPTQSKRSVRTRSQTTAPTLPSAIEAVSAADIHRTSVSASVTSYQVNPPVPTLVMSCQAGLPVPASVVTSSQAPVPAFLTSFSGTGTLPRCSVSAGNDSRESSKRPTAAASDAEGSDNVKQSKRRAQNRKAAERCRQKRKAEEEKLKKKFDDAEKEKKRSVQEIKLLWVQLTQLKKLLEQHRKCGPCFHTTTKPDWL